MSETYGQLEVASAAELRTWLAANHGEVKGVWLITYKKAAGDRHVSYEAVVRELLCFGWIDSQAKSLDAERSQLLITPRKARSNWSRPNKVRVAELAAAGLMEPAGLTMVELAKRTGTWTALDDAENLLEPADLVAALDGVPEARRYWDAFPPSARRATLSWIGAAKRPETRAKRIAQTVELAAQGLRNR